MKHDRTDNVLHVANVSDYDFPLELPGDGDGVLTRMHGTTRTKEPIASFAVRPGGLRSWASRALDAIECVLYKSAC